MARDETTAAALLQRKVDQIEQAKEKIDRDPEEAKAILAPHVAVDPSAGELTLRDIFGLFMQLQQSQQAMQERLAAQQEQLIMVLTQQQRHQERSQRETREEIEAARLQQQATLESWKTEPREPVWIEADLSEQKVYAVMGKYPPRVFRVNGIEFPIDVGEVVQVPQSIAALVRWSQKQRPLARPPDGLPQIADPARAQFLAGSQEISAGRPGHTGNGQLIPAAVASGPEQAQPLDVRYDHLGR